MKLLSKISSGFGNILRQVQPGFEELNLVTATAGAVFCVLCFVVFCFNLSPEDLTSRNLQKQNSEPLKEIQE